MNLQKRTLISNLLWIDCLGALTVGFLVLILSNSLVKFYNLPHQTIMFLGVMNLMYGSFSFYLAFRKQRSVFLVGVISIANILWTPVCWGLYWIYSSQISLLGTIHILGESLYVGLLGFLEWKSRIILSKSK